MDTHIPDTRTASVGADVVIAARPPKPVAPRGRAFAERIERNFPTALKKIDRWVGWRWAWRNGKWTKPPVRVDGNGYASSTDPGTWSTFDKAIAALKRSSNSLDGIGLVFVGDDDLAGVDVDHLPDHQIAAVILKNFAGTYCELSPTGKVHVWARGTVKHSGRKAAAEVEVYDSGRYFTVTGDQIDGSAAEVTNQQAALDWLHRKVFEKADPAKAEHRRDCERRQSDKEILEAARNADRNGAKFAAMFDCGNWQAYYESQSEADLWLCSRLAFYFGRSYDAIDRMFQQSGLMREKWNRSDYRNHTLNVAVNGSSETYSPPRSRPPAIMGRTNGTKGTKGNGATHPFDPGTGEVRPEPAEDDPDPLDIFGDPDLTGWPELTANCLPDPIFDYAICEGERIGADPVVVAAHALAACSTSISDEWRVQPKQFDRAWTQQARLWVCVVKDVGVRGTDIIKSAWKPLFERQARLREQWYLENQKWLERNPDHAGKKFVPTPGDPKPLLKRLTTSDASVERISDILAEGATDKIAYVADELALFFDFGRYSSSKNGGTGARAQMLQAYDGGPQNIDRVIKGSTYVKNWSISVSGNIQYRRLAEIAKFLVNDGLFQRLMTFHARTMPHRENDDIEQTGDHLTKYPDLHNMLCALVPTSQATDASVLTFDEGAREERQLFRRLIGRLTQDPTLPTIIRETAAKWEGLLARLSLIYHMIDETHQRLTQPALARATCPTGTSLVIGRATVIKAANFIQQLVLPNLFRLGYHTMPEDGFIGSHARWIAGYILARECRSISMSQIGRAYRELRGKTREFQIVMQFLSDAGWVAPEEQTRHDSFVWRVNPAVYTVFSARAKEERERREQVRELIKIKVANL